jgi:hypothetical protein
VKDRNRSRSKGSEKATKGGRGRGLNESQSNFLKET